MTAAAPARSLDVGSFLVAHPEFDFDLEEQVLASRYEQALRERLAAFVDAAETGDSARSRHALEAAIRAGSCDWVPRYRGYRRGAPITGLPVIGKADLRAAPEDFLSVAVDARDLWLKHTTGSSGPPMQIWYSGDFYFDFFLLPVPKVELRAGLQPPRDGRVYCLAISDNRAGRDFVVADPLGEQGLSVQVVVDERRRETFERLVALVRELEPWCVSTKPSIFEMLAAMAAAGDGYAPHVPGLLLSSGAELGKPVRDSLYRLRMGERVVSAYAMTEFGLIASECAEGGCHVDTSSIHAEVLDAGGEPVAPCAEGELVLSSVRNRAMPLLRYRTGDLGALQTDACPCGSHQPRIARMSGRKIVCYVLPSGELFSPTYFNDLFERFAGLAEFQLTQEAVGSFVLKIEPADGLADDAPLSDALQEYVAQSIPGSPRVHVVTERFGNDSKFERYRSAL